LKKFTKTFSILFLFGFYILQACGGKAENLKIGMTAPEFTLRDAFGTKYSLSAYKGKSPVIVYFYPKANTPGCTKEACGIRDNWSKFKENNITVLGISVDSKQAIQSFITDHNLNFPLLSDGSKNVSKEYGVLNNLGVDSRITFIVDKNGKIADIIRDVDVSSHADEVFNKAIKLI
jgi:peroxiredoxin Q/BCP